MQSLKTLDSISVTGKKVILRADLNVPIIDGKVTDRDRITRTIPTIKELIRKKAKVIIITHLGRPSGDEFEEKYSVKQIIQALSEELQTNVKFSSNYLGLHTPEEITNLQEGEVVLLENIRFYKEETKNDDQFAQALSQLGDVFVSDAFSTSHRAHASTVGITKYLPSVAGKLMEAEVTALSNALLTPNKPVAAIVGGAKVSTKLSVLINLVKKVDVLVISGGMANTFLYNMGVDIKKSLCEKNMQAECEDIIKHAKEANCRIFLPVDCKAAKDIKPNIEHMEISNRELPDDYEILDIGSKSISLIKDILKDTKTIVWNGPLGVFEVPPFDNGTNAIAQYVAELTTNNSDVISIGGGGDTVSALRNAGVYDQFTYISTAGGAFLEWLEGKDLPGVTALLS